MPTAPNIPLVLMRNLSVSTATVTADYTFVAVAGNKNTVRVPWSALAAGFITIAPGTPSGPTSGGAEGQITWDSTGVYTYTNGAWGKSPRLGTNWDDLTYDARFLLVNKIMSLSETEVANVLKTLGIGSATQEKAGLVTLATTMGENKGNVPTTAQVVDYVTEQLKEIEIGGGGGDKISAYQGGVDIKGPNGELILTYDSTARILYIGSGVDIVRSKTDTGVEYYGAGGDLKGAVDTQEQILGLYTAATAPAIQAFTFDTENEAIDSIRRGKVPLSADVQIRQGVKSASATQNEEMKASIEKESGPVRDPRTGKWLPTQRGDKGEIVKRATSYVNTVA